MDRKDDEEDPPGSSHWKHKRKKDKLDSPEMGRKKKKTKSEAPRETLLPEVTPAVSTAGPRETHLPEVTPTVSTAGRENILPEVTAAVSTAGACGGDADDRSTPTAEDYDSPDSQCAIEVPTLLEQLKDILDKYQDVQIIRELVQNADDANASEMKMIYVKDNPETTQGNDCYSDYFRAPALCVYNNAKFSEQDWKYIKRIKQSGKREDALKVGRFGLGFKSVFHITDTPVIISNDRAMIIDPLRNKKGLGNDCQVLTFKKLQKAVKKHYKQARAALESVYDHFGFTHQSLENGYTDSIFWFPLRRHPSELSTKVFDHDDVAELIAMFKKEAACLPLFLKNISHVSFSDQEKVSTSFSVTCDVLEKEEKTSFNKKLITCKRVSPDDSMQAIFPARVTVEDGTNISEQLWVICNYIKGRKDLSVELRALAEDKQLSYSPFVGLAAPVDDKLGIEFNGQVFCFLPLPNTRENHTGFPVHVNGFFALSQDRHHVKWPPDDQTERVDEAQRWNHLLCEEVLVDAYAATVEYVKGLAIKDNCTEYDANMVYRILPSQPDMRPNWDVTVHPLYKRLQDKSIFYTNNNGGQWIQGKDAIFSILQWPKDEPEASTIQQTEQCIFDLLLRYQRDVVRVPSHVAEMFPNVPRITPQYLRKVMRASNIYSSLSIGRQLLLLEFILADRRYDDLQDLQLLPLEDDTFRAFDAENPAYLCTANEMKMFPGTEYNFIKLEIPQQIGDHLKAIQKAGFCNLRILNTDEFPILLQDTFTANGKIGTSGCFTDTTRHITMEWLDHVWAYIGREYDTPETFEKLYLVPVTDDSRSDHSLELMPLKGFYLVADCDGMSPLSQDLRSALAKLPLTVIRNIAKGETHTNLMGAYCKYPNLEGLIELLEDLCEENSPSLEAVALPFNGQSSSKEKLALLNFLSKDCQHSSSGADNLIRELAIFPETRNEDSVVVYTSIAKNRRIACENSIPVKYPMPLLHLDAIQQKLAKRLGATEIPETKLVENILQAMTSATVVYERASIEDFMMYVLQNCTRLSSSSDLNVIIDLGSRIKFMEISLGSDTTELAPIRRFFDHTNQSLQKLFHFDNSKFLSEKYRKEELESTLRKFGLKSDTDVKEDDVFTVIKIIDRECRKEKQTKVAEIRNCSLQLMDILDKMNGESDIALDLNGYRWVTFIDKKPLHYPDMLPLYGDQFESLLCAPQDAFSNKHETLSASVTCIVETSSHPHLAEKYGWNKPPEVDICLRQLKEVRRVFRIKHKAKLNGIIKDLYAQLFRNINVLDEELKSQPIVCTGEEFNLPTDIFISFPSDENIDLEPYMYKLPVEFSEFSEMFVRLGSTNEHNTYSLNTILTKIKTSTGTSTSTAARRMAVNILKMIATLPDGRDILEDVLVPVQSHDEYLDLRPVKECTYSDSDSGWLRGDDEEDDDVSYVHSEVSAELSQSLGIQSFTQRFLSDGGTDEMMSACGQSEPLTTRLKHLLENYPDGLAVLKELVQNADDAGAQHIHFLYDERQNTDATTGLIDVNMAKCQGPAFWAFNDAKFTDRDFENIVKLGGETKKNTKTKIGKFGLGFSAVYNLTDVPSFISGRSLVIFDPHTTHLGKAIKDKPVQGYG